MLQARPFHKTDKLALLALGSNLPFGDLQPREVLTAGLDALLRCANEIVQLQALSRFFRSPAHPAGSGPDYVNATALLRLRTEADSLLAHLHKVESMFGRTRMGRWQSRSLDLDLLAVESQVLPDSVLQAAWMDLPPEEQARRAPDRLILPHPRLQDRAFVLVPLAEIAPRWRHPRDGRSVPEMLAALPAAERSALRPV